MELPALWSLFEPLFEPIIPQKYVWLMSWSYQLVLYGTFQLKQCAQATVFRAKVGIAYGLGWRLIENIVQF